MPEPINITFLGTGAAVPTLKRRHPAIILQYGGDYLLFDCGEGTQLRMVKARVSPLRISRIFITHWHADHFAGLLPLIETLHLSRKKDPLEVFGPEASFFIDALMELSYWGIGFKIKTRDCGEEDLEKLVETDTFEVYSIKVKHTVPAVGYMFKEKDHWHIDVNLAGKFGLKGKQLRVIKEKGSIKIGNKTIKLNQIAEKKEGRKVVYSGDTLAYEKLFQIAENADIMIHDGTFVEHEESRAHSSVQDIAKLAKKYKIKKLILTHFSRRYKNEKEIIDAVRPIFKNSVLAEDLMKITLD